MMIMVKLLFRILSRIMEPPVGTREQATENRPLLQDMIKLSRHMNEVNQARLKLGGRDRSLSTSNATLRAKSSSPNPPS